jgi:hypothetical protein
VVTVDSWAFPELKFFEQFPAFVSAGVAVVDGHDNAVGEGGISTYCDVVGVVGAVDGHGGV